MTGTECEPKSDDAITKEEETGSNKPLTPDRARKLFTSSLDMAVRTLVEQISEESLILADEHERRAVWPRDKCSRLIESLLINVPIPPLFFAELEDTKYAVIDGQQRLTAINDFLTGKYKLRKLRVMADLNGKKFSELPSELQRHLRSRPLRCIIIQKESDPNIRFDVFERLNTASVQLSPQELRNCLYRGPLNITIKKLADDPEFKFVRDVTKLDRRMKDEETVLRFFAFHDDLEKYNGNFKDFLDRYQGINALMNERDIESKVQLFNRVIQDVKLVFGKSAFRKYNLAKDDWEPLINRPLYEAVMLCYSHAQDADIRENAGPLLAAHKTLCQDPEFDDSISTATIHKPKIKMKLTKYRMAMIEAGVPVEDFQWWLDDQDEPSEEEDESSEE